MKSVPRILPLLGVAAAGVLAVNAIAGARDLPSLVSGAQAWAEEAAKGGKAEKAEKPAAKGKEGEGAAEVAKDAASAALPAASITPKPVCAPTAAELAKQAGLSPAELQVLQSLGARRGQLDARENDLNTQLALMAAAEAKLDAKIRALNGLKSEVNGLLNQANTKEAGEIDRLVKVFEGMKAKDAAPRMVALDDSVRIPIAAKMKERALSAIIAQMPPAEAKKLTEALAKRFSDAQAAAARASAAAAQTQAQPAKASVDPTAPEAQPKRQAAARKPAPRKRAPAAQQAAAKPAAAAPAPATPAAPQPYAPPAAAPAAAPAAKTG